jgi:hypothetical protein
MGISYQAYVSRGDASWARLWRHPPELILDLTTLLYL